MSRSSLGRSSLPQGLTLVELVVVLAILAVLAGVAVRSLEPIADQARYEATQKTLESVKNAIVDDRQQASGTRQISGFVSDIGRLPEYTWMLIDSAGSTEFSTGDGSLADRATDSFSTRVVGHQSVEQFNVRQAILTSTSGAAAEQYKLVLHPADAAAGVTLASFSFGDRLGPAASTPANPTPVDCTGVSLRCGWRGPYLTVADPNQGIVDGWGREIGLGPVPSVGDEVHVTWTAVTNEYTDQLINVQRLALQTVSGFIQDPSGAAKVAEVVLVYPDPTLSTSTLAVMADADGNNNDNRFRFDNVPVGVRALVLKETGGSRQTIRYIEVTPMQQANLPITISEF